VKKDSPEPGAITAAHVVATLPADIFLRKQVLEDLLAILPGAHPAIAPVRQVLLPLDKHIIEQREFEFPQPQSQQNHKP